MLSFVGHFLSPNEELELRSALRFICEQTLICK